MAVKDVMLIGVIIFALGIGFLIIHYSMTTVTNQILNNTVINSSQASVAAFTSVKTTVARLDYVGFAAFIGLVLALIITGYLVGGYPIFMFFYFLVIIIMVALSTILSNIWETVSQSTTFLVTTISFPMMNNLLLNLPYYMAVVGFIGVVVMFAKPYFQGTQ